jgi:DMSO/TMAO reductase YedYZ molybdopterin-dependent catalytic subunit
MRRLALVSALLLSSAPALAADPAPPTGVEVTGQVQHPARLTPADLAAMPQLEVQAEFETGHGREGGRYGGVLLLTVLDRAAAVDGPQKGSHLRHTIIVTGSDGYAVAVAMGEIDPKFEGKTVLLATSRDGKPLDPKDGVRLVVPGDCHGGRSVRDVVKVSVE